MPPSRTATPSPTLPPLPVGLDALVDLDSIAELRPPGMRVEQVSSYDRSGGNVDLGVGPDTAELLRLLGAEPTEIDNSYLYRDGDRYVIFDELGPGVVYRIWMTGLDALFLGGLQGDIAFELDDEPAPRLQLPRAELFSGQRAPFVTPLAGDNMASSGRLLQRRADPLRAAPAHHDVDRAQLDARHLREAAARNSGRELRPPRRQLRRRRRSGRRRTRSERAAPSREDEVGLDVAPGAAQAVWETGGAGAILRLELTAPAGAEIPLGLRLQAFWDGAAAPQVDAPLDDLFGASLGPAARSLAFGRDGDRFYFYFPMPFRRGRAPRLLNDGEERFAGWRLRMASTTEAPSPRAAILHARSASARHEPDGRDYVLLDTAGTGHVVGVVLTAGCGDAGRCQLDAASRIDGAHLEGDEHIAVDGSRYPQIHGTGLEDFFNGGFYFLRGPFTLPTHGNPAQARRPRRAGPGSTCAAPTASSSATRSRSRATSASASSTGR